MLFRKLMLIAVSSLISVLIISLGVVMLYNEQVKVSEAHLVVKEIKTESIKLKGIETSSIMKLSDYKHRIKEGNLYISLYKKFSFPFQYELSKGKGNQDDNELQESTPNYKDMEMYIEIITDTSNIENIYFEDDDESDLIWSKRLME